MSSLQPLQLIASDTARAATPQQKRFNTLVQQIERARGDLQTWQDNLPAYWQTYAAQVEPLHDELDAARRQWVLALDGLTDAPGLSRAETALLNELIVATAGDLLAAKRDDAELRALFARYSGAEFDTEEEPPSPQAPETAQAPAGADPADAAPAQPDAAAEDEQAWQAQEAMREAAREQQAAERERQSASRRRGHAQKKREAQAQQSVQSVREIFRKLASALHPDREADPAQREAKTALMQKVNQAYGAGDLLTLFQLQVEIEQADAAAIAGAGEEKLRHYNQVLTEQLGHLKQEINRVATGFCYDTGLQPGAHVNPAKLSGLIGNIKLQLREDLLDLQE
ncbi:MAG TPA: J domain-containing protein, partial [Burkholderiales bacterium]